MRNKRVLAVVLASALAVGYLGAAAFSAWSTPAIAIADDFGPDDGLTRYVVRATSGAVTDDLLAALEGVHGVVSAQRLHDGGALVATEGLAPHHLEVLPGVGDAEFSPSVPVLGTLTDPYVPSYGYNLDNTGTNSYNRPAVVDADVDAPEGWDGGTGAGVIVAVVDTGYDSDHPELAGALWTNPAEACGSADSDGNGKAGDCHGWNFTTNSPDVDNGSSGTHGTSVSGVVGGRANNGQGTAGVAPDVTIMPLVIGSGSSVDVVLGAEAIRYAVDHGADVINASWGGGFGGWALSNLRSAIDYAAAHGVLVVAAAGNDAADRDASPMYPASLTEVNVVTVGNSTAADRISSSSAYGATSVDLFAPGDLVFTTWNDGGYRLVSGTSIAAPQVAAAYALYRAAWPDATAAELRQALLADVDPVPAFAGASVTGGRLSIGNLAEGGLGAVRYLFTSMSAPAGVVTPGVRAAGKAAAGEYAVTLGLGMEFEGEIWAVADQDLTLGGTTVTTDDAGEASFDLGAAASPAELDLSPTLELEDGRYVLTVQLRRDGDPGGRTYAAPLLVGAVAEAGPGNGGSTPGDGGTGDPGNGASGSGGSGSGDSDSGSGDSGSGDGDGSGGSDTGSDSGSDEAGNGSGNDGGSGDSAPGDSGTGNGGSSDGDPGNGSDGSGALPEAPSDGGSTPDSPAGDGGDSSAPTNPTDGTDGSGPSDATDGSGGADAPDDSSGDPAPGDGGSVTYPGVGPFSITGMSPVRVSTTGGTLVTITGTALPTDARVRIGDSATAVVVSSSEDRLEFRVPERVAGVYDVHVFARDGRTSVLADALTYTDDPLAPSGDDTDGTDGTDGSSGPGADGGSGDSGSGPGDDSSDGPEGSNEPVVRSGPTGERLVRTTRFAGLGSSFWATDCSSSCSGVPL